jgi:hypothetical protein
MMEQRGPFLRTGGGRAVLLCIRVRDASALAKAKGASKCILKRGGC